MSIPCDFEAPRGLVWAAAFGVMFMRGVGLLWAAGVGCAKEFVFDEAGAGEGAFGAIDGFDWVSTGVDTALEEGEPADAGVWGRLPFPLEPPNFARRFARI